jgi:hypothetical protein
MDLEVGVLPNQPGPWTYMLETGRVGNLELLKVLNRRCALA